MKRPDTSFRSQWRYYISVQSAVIVGAMVTSLKSCGVF